MFARNLFFVVGAFVASAIVSEPDAQAHCDALDGPVAKAGQAALDSGNLDLALVWIQPAAEAELRAAFQQARGVRGLNKQARELADRFFLETLVRLHRAGEGEPYTGLKPKGRDLGPAIPAADAAVRSGSTAAVAKLVTDAVNEGLHDRLHRVIATQKYKPSDVAAGREHVAAYVAFVHYVERLYSDARASAPQHAEPAGHAGH